MGDGSMDNGMGRKKGAWLVGVLMDIQSILKYKVCN